MGKIFILLLSFLGAVAAQTGKIETLGPLTDSSVADAVKKVLDTKGYRITLDDGGVACEIWLRNGVPAQAKKDVDGAIYPQLTESTLVGVLHFPKAASDYRGQTIPAGFYTLRYELIPNDGNHLGVAPNRDFVLLVPAGSDSDPNAVFKFQELVDLSRKATGTRHPVPLSLVPAEQTSAAVSKDDQDHSIFSSGLKLSSGEEIPLGLVVRGQAQQ